MKKTVILVATALSIVACNKSETANQNEVKKDNTSAVTQENNNNADSLFSSVGGNIKIDKEEINKIHEKMIEETNSSIDSLAKTNQKIPEIINETIPEENKITEKQSKPQVKVIKETKIIYKEKPSPKITTLNPIIKSGNLSFSVEDNNIAVSEFRYLVKKYNGKIKSENLTTANNKNTNYIIAKIPLKEYDYLLEDLLNNLGTLNDKNLEITGENYKPNTLCNLEITLYSNNLPVIKESDTFGKKAVNAVSTGWEVIGNILLFFLPFWPLFLVITLGYLYFRKKKTEQNQEKIL